MNEEKTNRAGNARGRHKRLEIIQAALELFGEVGFHGASLRDIAARAGMSHPGMLHHFPTKVALLEAVLERRDEVDEAAMQEDFDDGLNRLQALLRVVARNSERRTIVELFVALSAEATSVDHPAHDFFVTRYERTVALVELELRRRQDIGDLRKGVIPLAAARNIVALMDGLQIQWLLATAQGDNGQVDMVAGLRDYMESIVIGGV